MAWRHNNARTPKETLVRAKIVTLGTNVPKVQNKIMTIGTIVPNVKTLSFSLGIITIRIPWWKEVFNSKAKEVQPWWRGTPA